MNSTIRVSSSVLLKNAIAFFNKMYREHYHYKLLDTIPSKSGITRRDGEFFIPVKSKVKR
ncbi:hypothetical protein SAMN05443549_105156 [Flavobacterium fluvii]|uniref:Uncharacterized protein n=1 Tax=Flavobacterium fluvii TaxID=468056 RepID=A0A1M5LC29_9FLAO|nr:hypothetical protein SAMN05443549_105156 [Flavobacterium fluvii]